MFLTKLEVAHRRGKEWELTKPLVWEGQWQYFVIRTGFQTDFASIPKPVRWLLDSAGHNAEAAVLHDAVWRESRRGQNRRVDPWHADGIFRSALRETGSTALTRGLMWFAVRAVATAGGRFGRKGPPVAAKVFQLLGMLVLGVVTALGPTAVALVGLAIYWVFNWLVAIAWLAYERGRSRSTNWPWPIAARPENTAPPGHEMLIIFNKPTADVSSGETDAVRTPDDASEVLLELLSANPLVGGDEIADKTGLVMATSDADPS